MKTVFLTMMALVLSTSVAKAAPSEQEVLVRYMTNEANKDLQGKKSCFNGSIQAKDAEMQDSYGGRYSSETPEMSALKVGEENSRYWDKYCNGYLDKDKKPVDSREKAAYEICHGSFSSTYVVSAGFSFSTTGSSGTEPVLTLVSTEYTEQYIIDLNYKGEGDGIVSTRKISSKIKCQDLKM